MYAKYRAAVPVACAAPPQIILKVISQTLLKSPKGFSFSLCHSLFDLFFLYPFVHHPVFVAIGTLYMAANARRRHDG